MNRTLFALGLAALAATPALAVDSEVTVVVDMTQQGRAAAHPTPDHPLYYYPDTVGYTPIGSVPKGIPPPDPHAMVHLIAAELAKQGYLAVNPAHPAPDLLVSLQWGYIAADASDQDQGTANGFGIEDPHDKRLMLEIVLGHSMASPEATFNRMYAEAANVDRYFVVVNAYDFPAWRDHHKRVALWSDRMSLPSGGIDFAAVAAAIVKAGGPMLGRETGTLPKEIPTVPEGHVNVGTPTVK